MSKDAPLNEISKVPDTLTYQRWEQDLLPARSVCELYDHLEEILFWIKNRSGRYCWANTATLLNFALTRREDLLGKSDFDIMSAHLASQVVMDDELVLTGRSITNRIELVGRFDHTARWCVTCKLPLMDAHGNIIGTAGITRPVKSGSEDWLGMPLGKVVGFMSEHFREPLDNKQLAQVAGLSERTFERRFREHYGLSPQQYVKRLRVRMACNALVYTDHSIGTIAVEHGFADQSHFTREFHELIGVTPGDYRKGFLERKA